MPEIGTSGLMSGEGKRADCLVGLGTALLLDSTQFSALAPEPPAGVRRTSRKKYKVKYILDMRLKKQEQAVDAIRLLTCGSRASRRKNEKAKPIFTARVRPVAPKPHRTRNSGQP